MKVSKIRKLTGVITVLLLMLNMLVPSITASAKAGVVYAWDWANLGDPSVPVIRGGWYVTAPSAGEQVATSIIGDKLVYDTSVNAGVTGAGKPSYAISFQHKTNARLVYNVGSDKYTFRLPIKITNANKDGFVGDGMYIMLHNGSTELQLCMVNYKGAIIVNGSTWLKGNGFLKESTEYVFDFVVDTNGNIVLYIDGVKIGSYKISAVGTYINQFRVKINPAPYGTWQNSQYIFGNPKLFKGDIYTASNITPSLSAVMIPPEGKVVNVDFTSVGSEAAGEGAVWSLGGQYDGVSITADGKMIVTGSAKAGTVKVVVTDANGVATSLNYTLIKTCIDFEDYTISSEAAGKWFTGEIRQDTDNRYMHAEAAHDGLYPQARFRLPDSLGGKFVVEAKIRKPEGHIGSSLAFVNGASEWNSRLHFDRDSSGLYAQYDWEADAGEKIYIKSGEWTDVRVVVDATNKKATYFVDGKLLTKVNTDMKYKDSASPIKYIVSELDIDDFNVYTAYVSAPEAYNAKIEGNAYPGGKLKAGYTYFSINDYEEDCTDVKWYVADSENSENWTIAGSGLEFVPGTENDGKFVKFGVTPACAETMAGEIVYSDVLRICELIEVKDEDVVITNESGEDVITTGANTATYSLTLSNFTASEETIWVIAAAYEDGEFIDAYISPYVLASGASDVSASSQVSASFTDSSKAEFKFFVWTGNCDPVKKYTTHLDY